MTTQTDSYRLSWLSFPVPLGPVCCRSSVVEHCFGKAEAPSSILGGSTTTPPARRCGSEGRRGSSRERRRNEELPEILQRCCRDAALPRPRIEHGHPCPPIVGRVCARLRPFVHADDATVVGTTCAANWQQRPFLTHRSRPIGAHSTHPRLIHSLREKSKCRSKLSISKRWQKALCAGSRTCDTRPGSCCAVALFSAS